MDIENLASLVCMQNHESTTVAGQSSDDLSWLASFEGRSEDTLPPIEKVCRANEVCRNFSECVCDENCAGEVKQRSEEKNGSLLLVPCERSSSFPKFSIFEEELIVSDWLIGTKAKNQSENKNDSSVEWLCQGIVSDNQNVLDYLDKDESMPDFNKQDSYLGSIPVTEMSSGPMDLLYKYHSTMSAFDWLNVSHEKDDDIEIWLSKKDGDCKETEDSNKRLVEEDKYGFIKKLEELQISTDDLTSSDQDFVKIDSSTATVQWSHHDWLLT